MLTQRYEALAYSDRAHRCWQGQLLLHNYGLYLDRRYSYQALGFATPCRRASSEEASVLLEALPPLLLRRVVIPRLTTGSFSPRRPFQGRKFLTLGTTSLSSRRVIAAKPATRCFSPVPSISRTHDSHWGYDLPFLAPRDCCQACDSTFFAAASGSRAQASHSGHHLLFVAPGGRVQACDSKLLAVAPFFGKRPSD